MQSRSISPNDIRAVKQLDAELENHRLLVDPNWAIVSRELLESDPQPMQLVTGAGMWKAVTSSRCPQYVFEAPLAVVDEIGSENEEGEGVRLEGLRRLV